MTLAAIPAIWPILFGTRFSAVLATEDTRSVFGYLLTPIVVLFQKPDTPRTISPRVGSGNGATFAVQTFPSMVTDANGLSKMAGALDGVLEAVSVDKPL